MRDIPTLILPVLKAAITLFVRVCVFMPNSYRILFSFDEFSFTLQALLLSIVLGLAPADSCQVLGVLEELEALVIKN